MEHGRDKRHGISRRLLGGAAAGPLFVGIFSAIGAKRPGYDWKRHTVSTLAATDRGWVQRANFLVAGSLYTFAASALWRLPRQKAGPRAVSLLLAGAGLGLIGSGVFVTDPIAGYPPRADDDDTATSPTLRSREGSLHNVCAIPIFFGIPLAGIASAVAALAPKDYRWAAYSAGSSAAMIGSFVLMGKAFSDDHHLAGKAGMFQRTAIVSGLGWASSLSLRALMQSSAPR